MEIKVEVKLESNKSDISQSKKTGSFCAKIKSAAKNNMANEELMGLLSRRFKVPQKSIRIIKGRKSTHKVLEIKDADL